MNLSYDAMAAKLRNALSFAMPTEARICISDVLHALAQQAHCEICGVVGTHATGCPNRTQQTQPRKASGLCSIHQYPDERDYDPSCRICWDAQQAQPEMPTLEQVAMACCKAWEDCSCTAPCGQVLGWQNEVDYPAPGKWIDDPMGFKKTAAAVQALYQESRTI